MSTTNCSDPVRTGPIRRAAAVVVMAAAAVAMARPAAANIITVTPASNLQAAINMAVAGDTIQFAPGMYPITSTLNLALGQDVTIAGDPHMATVLDGGGNNLLTLLRVLANKVAIQNLTLQNAGTAIEWEGNNGPFKGLSVAGVTITGTTTTGFYTQSGGVLSFTNSTIAYNTGRGIESESTSTPAFGAPVNLTNVTVSHNGVGVYTSTSIPWDIGNSLIVGNGFDCHLQFLIGTQSIDTDGTCAATPLPPGPVPFGGFSTVAYAALGLDPNLGANGGPTLTEAIVLPGPARQPRHVPDYRKD